MHSLKNARAQKCLAFEHKNNTLERYASLFDSGIIYIGKNQDYCQSNRAIHYRTQKSEKYRKIENPIRKYQIYRVSSGKKKKDKSHSDAL